VNCEKEVVTILDPVNGIVGILVLILILIYFDFDLFEKYKTVALVYSYRI
jgi:hypothetical protein